MLALGSPTDARASDMAVLCQMAPFSHGTCRVHSHIQSFMFNT